MQKISCPVCHHHRRLPLWSHRNDRFLSRLSIRETIRYWVCTNCGLGFGSPQLDEAEAARLYTTSYRDEVEEIPSTHFATKEKQATDRLNWLFQKYPKTPAAVLEIGCSEGVFLKTLRDEYGWAVKGIDPYLPYLKHGRDQWGLDVEPTFFKSGNFAEKFDLVVFMHVIEHVHDPVAFLRDVRRVMKDDGCIFFETPEILHPHVGKIKHALFPSPHLQIFSALSISHLLKKTGFEIIHLYARGVLRVVARVAPAQEPEKRSLLSHAAGLALKYQYWGIAERSLLARRALAGFVSRRSKGFLGRKNYNRLRSLYRRW